MNAVDAFCTPLQAEIEFIGGHGRLDGEITGALAHLHVNDT